MTRGWHGHPPALWHAAVLDFGLLNLTSIILWGQDCEVNGSSYPQISYWFHWRLFIWRFPEIVVLPAPKSSIINGILMVCSIINHPFGDPISLQHLWWSVLQIVVDDRSPHASVAPSKLAENGRRFASNRGPHKIWTITRLKYTVG